MDVRNNSLTRHADVLAHFNLLTDLTDQLYDFIVDSQVADFLGKESFFISRLVGKSSLHDQLTQAQELFVLAYEVSFAVQGDEDSLFVVVANFYKHRTFFRIPVRTGS